MSRWASTCLLLLGAVPLACGGKRATKEGGIDLPAADSGASVASSADGAATLGFLYTPDLPLF